MRWAQAGMVLSLALVGAATTGSVTARSDEAVLVFALEDPGETGGELEEMSDSRVAGISWRFRWKALERREGEIDWESIDAALASSKAGNKKAMLRVVAGQHTPDWVYDAGAEPFEFGRQHLYHSQQHRAGVLRMPVPWDEVYLEKWTRFVRAFGERYDGLELVYGVHMSGGGRIGEMNLPKNLDGWQKAGYTNDKLVGAWKTIIDAYRKALPETPTILAINRPLRKPSHAVVDDVVEYVLEAYPGDVYLQQNGLREDSTTDHPMRTILRRASGKTTVGYQMVGGAGWLEDVAGDPNVALGHARSDGASYVEVYARDLRRGKLRGSRQD